MPTRHMHTQHANTHCEYTNMRYAVQHALMQAQYACAKCMRTTATWHSPKIKVQDEPTRGFPSITFLEKTFEVAEKPSLLGNKYKGQMAEPLPACQGPWGMLHQISRRLPVRVSRSVCRNRLGKVMLVAVNLCRPGATVPI